MSNQDRPDEPPTNPYSAGEPSSYGSPTQPPYGSQPQPPYGGGQPQPQCGQYGQQPEPYGGHPGYGTGQVPHPSATTAMVLGLVSLIGLFICVVPIVLAPFAWRTGGRVIREIDADPARWSGREQAQAGRIMGMIGTVILVLGVLAIAALVAVLVIAAPGSFDATTTFDSDV